MKQKNSTESALDWLSLVNMDDYDLMLERIALTEKAVVVGFLNQHAYNLIEQRSQVKESFSKIDYLLRDGIGIKIACKANGLLPGLNLNGTDFIPRIISRLRQGSGRSLQFFAFGTQEPWLSRGAEQLTGTRDVVLLDGFQNPGSYIEFFEKKHKQSSLAVIILAMGMPKQEEVAQMLKAAISGPAIIICGGAILDFASGRVERAPDIMRRTGTEWLYRLCKEPKRLFQRYIFGIPLFFVYVLRNLLKEETAEPSYDSVEVRIISEPGHITKSKEVMHNLDRHFPHSEHTAKENELYPKKSGSANKALKQAREQ